MAGAVRTPGQGPRGFLPGQTIVDLFFVHVMESENLQFLNWSSFRLFGSVSRNGANCIRHILAVFRSTLGAWISFSSF